MTDEEQLDPTKLHLSVLAYALPLTCEDEVANRAGLFYFHYSAQRFPFAVKVSLGVTPDGKPAVVSWAVSCGADVLKEGDYPINLEEEKEGLNDKARSLLDTCCHDAGDGLGELVEDLRSWTRVR